MSGEVIRTNIDDADRKAREVVVSCKCGDEISVDLSRLRDRGKWKAECEINGWSFIGRTPLCPRHTEGLVRLVLSR